MITIFLHQGTNQAQEMEVVPDLKFCERNQTMYCRKLHKKVDFDCSVETVSIDLHRFLHSGFSNLYFSLEFHLEMTSLHINSDTVVDIRYM